MYNFKELKVWQRAVDLSVKIYQVTNDFPNHEQYGLTSQIRRSAVSIASNIAEGAGRRSVGDFRRFIDIAVGSSCELETQLLIAAKLQYISMDKFVEFEAELTEINKMLSGLKKSL